MLKTKVLAALLGLFAFSSSPAFGQSATIEGYALKDFELLTAQDLLNICTLDNQHADYSEALSFCYGYLAGGRAYHDGLVVVRDYNPIVCPPPNATRRDAVRVFVGYIEAHSEHREKPAMQMVVRALAEEWPCAK